MNNDIGYFKSIQGYIQGKQPYDVEGNQQPAGDIEPKQGSFKGKRVLAVAGAGLIGAAISTILCIPGAIVYSTLHGIAAIRNSKDLYNDDKMSFPALVTNILLELTLGFAIRTIALTFTFFIDISLDFICYRIGIETTEEMSDKHSTTSNLLRFLDYHKKIYNTPLID